jgi:hypothetical protein
MLKDFGSNASDAFQGVVGDARQLVGDVIAGRDNPALTHAISHMQEALLSVVGEKNVQNVIDGKFPILSPAIHTGEALTNKGLEALVSGLRFMGIDQVLPFDLSKLNTADIGAFLLNMDKVQDSAGNDIYTARKDCWQRSVGYNDLWDFGFGLGTSMQREKFSFEHNGEEMMFWAWKGDYINLGAGAELGIYTRFKDGDVPTDHWVSNENLELEMRLTLKDKKGNVIIDNYNPNEPQWWITGFNPALKGVNASDLVAEYTIDFTGREDMYASFVNSADYLNNQDKWSTDENNKYVLKLTI